VDARPEGEERYESQKPGKPEEAGYRKRLYRSWRADDARRNCFAAVLNRSSDVKKS